MSRRRSAHRRQPPALMALALLLAAAPMAAAQEKLLWMPISDAMLLVDSKPAKLWTLYHAGKEKKEHRLLLQIDTRYLMIDTQLRLITEYEPLVFEKKGKNQEMPRDMKGVKALTTEDWILRDIGTSYLIQTKLKDEGHVLEIHLPKMPDFRNVLW